MRRFRQILFSVTFMTICFALASGETYGQKGFLFFKKSNISKDTSEIYHYTNLALSKDIPKNTKGELTKDSRVDLMKAYIDTAEMICRQKKVEIPSLLHLARAEYFFITSNFNDASMEANIALKLAANEADNLTLAKTHSFLGKYSQRTGFFKESIDYYAQSIEIARKNRFNGFIPVNYWGISLVFRSLGDWEGYHSNLELMINAAIQENDTANTKSGCYLLGTSLTEHLRDFKKSDSLLNKCLELALLTDDTNHISLSLANIGWNLYVEKEYDKALKSYTKSLTYSIPGNLHAFAANSLGNIGTIYRDMGEVEKSLNYYKKSIQEAEKVDDIYDLQWVYMDMSEMYIRQRDTANAYINYVLFKKFSDSYIKSTNTQGLTDARIRYEADAHNKELELLSLRNKKQQILIYGYTGLFILCLVIGVLLLSRSRLKAKRRISEMNRKISEITQANLRQQMNPHFIFNTLNSIQYYMYQHDKLATNNYLTKFSSLMRKVLENSQHTSVPLRDELDALILYLDLEKIRFKEKFDYSIDVDEEIDTLLYKVPTMLIQPYVENSICHGLMPGNQNGHISINLKLKKEYISCIIEDNGIGREAAQEKKNRSDNNHNSLGTRIVTSRLDLVNTLYGTTLKTVYTDLKNENGEAEGTRVEIHIPILS